MNAMTGETHSFVRKAEGPDVSAIAELVNRAFAVERFFKSGDRIDNAEVSELMQTGSFLLLTDGGALTSCVYVKLNGERSYIGLLAVDPSMQKSGIGTRMMREAEDLSRRAGCRFADIRVVSVRPELPLIYRKLGYAESGTESAEVIETATMPVHFVTMSKAL